MRQQEAENVLAELNARMAAMKSDPSRLNDMIALAALESRLRNWVKVGLPGGEPPEDVQRWLAANPNVLADGRQPTTEKAASPSPPDTAPAAATASLPAALPPIET